MSLDGESTLFGALVSGLPLGATIWSIRSIRSVRPAEGGDQLVLRAANGAASAALGFDLTSCVGQRLEEIFPAANPQWRCLWFDLARAPAQRRSVDATYGDHRVATSTFTLTPIPLAAGFIGVLLENLSSRLRNGHEVHTLNSFLDSIIENIPAMVFVKDARTLSFQRFNRAGEELLGLPRSSLIGKNDNDFFPPDQAEFFHRKDREVLASGQLLDIPVEPIQTPRGERWLHTKKIPISDAAGEARYLLGISEDITDRKHADEARLQAHHQLEERVAERTRALQQANAELMQEMAERQRAEAALRQSEEKLRHAQKMEAIGRLAGGVAHDFNNLLSIILSYSDLVVEELEADNPLRAQVQQIAIAGDRARQLTRQLLAFSRQQVMQPEVLDLSRVVMGLEPMLRRLVVEDIDFQVLLRRSTWLVKADRGQIEQIVMNLVVNARDAMPGGGRLTVETADIAEPIGDDGDASASVAGPHVMLAVSDTGSGMDVATRARIFEPFFSTKPQGRGTGLGLSTVFGIVKQSGGQISVTSAPGQGSTFRVYLPRTDEARGEASLPPPPPATTRGAETILLVEDEIQVRSVATEILRRSGYHVLEARNVGDALRIAEQYRGELHLLLTDVVMPILGGGELAKRITAARPTTRVLYMSGYADDAIVRQGVLDLGIAFLQKPLVPGALVQRVRQLLDQPSDAARSPR